MGYRQVFCHKFSVDNPSGLCFSKTENPEIFPRASHYQRHPVDFGGWDANPIQLGDYQFSSQFQTHPWFWHSITSVELMGCVAQDTTQGQPTSIPAIFLWIKIDVM